jgi:hypothetical protein
MSDLQIDYDSIAEIYDLYVTADYDVPFFLSEAAKAGGLVLELTAGTGRLQLPLVVDKWGDRLRNSRIPG